MFTQRRSLGLNTLGYSLMIIFIFAHLLLPRTLQAEEKSPELLVILDPGHGGDDTGAIQTIAQRRVTEKEITLNIAKKASNHLHQYGIQTLLTRSTDQSLSLDQRIEIANTAVLKAHQTIFISIHANSAKNKSSSGIETYVLNAASNKAAQRLADLENGSSRLKHRGIVELILADLTTTANYHHSMELACSIQKNVFSGLQSRNYEVRNRGVRQALFYVLMQTHMPGVLFEAGFSSSPRELSRLIKSSYQDLLGQQIANGILLWKQLLAKREYAKAHPKLISAIQKDTTLEDCYRR